MYISFVYPFLYVRVLSAHESGEKVSTFSGNPSLENSSLSRETKDDERGRGASIASPFNDDRTFEKKSFQRE